MKRACAASSCPYRFQSQAPKLESAVICRAQGCFICHVDLILKSLKASVTASKCLGQASSIFTVRISLMDGGSPPASTAWQVVVTKNMSMMILWSQNRCTDFNSLNSIEAPVLELHRHRQVPCCKALHQHAHASRLVGLKAACAQWCSVMLKEFCSQTDSLGPQCPHTYYVLPHSLRS